MGATQTSVADPANAFPGMLADNDQGLRITSRVSEEASAEIPFGVMVVRGADKDDGMLLAHTSASASAALLAGVMVHRQIYARDSDQCGLVGLKPGIRGDLLQRGHIFVMPEDDCDPDDPVKVRVVVAGAEVKGAFRGSADGTDCIDISKFARWVRTGGPTSGKCAVLEIDLVGAKQAVADA